MTEPRKATDILLEMENKLDAALSIIRTQDLNIKILSNKLNGLLEALEKKGAEPKVMVEAVNTKPNQTSIFNADPERSVVVDAEAKLPLESEPQGFRRTSRPETFAGDDAYLPNQPASPKYPVQMPKAPPGRAGNAPPGRTAEATVMAPAAATEPPVPAAPPQKQQVNVVQNAIPVSQRVVNAQGKSLFMAEVEIIDLTTMQPFYKTRTNGTGKWMASLGIGEFRVIIRKFEPTTKEKLEVTQDIQVDGTVSPLELQAVIIKS